MEIFVSMSIQYVSGFTQHLSHSCPSLYKASHFRYYLYAVTTESVHLFNIFPIMKGQIISTRFMITFYLKKTKQNNFYNVFENIASKHFYGPLFAPVT